MSEVVIVNLIAPFLAAHCLAASFYSLIRLDLIFDVSVTVATRHSNGARSLIASSCSHLANDHDLLSSIPLFLFLFFVSTHAHSFAFKVTLDGLYSLCFLSDEAPFQAGEVWFLRPNRLSLISLNFLLSVLDIPS